MIKAEEVTNMIQAAIPGAVVTVADATGTGDHLSITVASAAFAGISPLNRHRTVQKALAAAMTDGRIHALEIKTEIPTA